MNHDNARLVRELYEARGRGDLEAVRSMLADDVVWYEPDVGGEHDGDHRGPEEVLGMMRDASERTGGTFRLVAREVVANGEHAVAMVDWSAERGGERLEGKEAAVYRVRGGKVVEASFHQDDVDLDRRFWEYG
jgi:ketosteroid isomerase-like protein